MNKKTYEGISGGIMLIGIGLLFLTGIGFWPWILLVIGLAGLPASLAQERGWYGWQGLFWLVGLAILFATDLIWPGILILIGVSMLFGAVTREGGGSPFATKSLQAPQTSTEEGQPFSADKPE